MANQRLVSTLAKNLANMEHFARRDAVSFILTGLVLFVCFSSSCSISCHVFTVQLEKLVLAVEQQQGGDARSRASFLVLTQSLLLSLGELSKTQHMLTAQRVYLLLEPRLLEVIRNSSSQVTPTPTFKLSSIYPTERRLTQCLLLLFQEAEPNVSIPQSYSAALTAYLSRCESQGTYFGFTLLSLLGDFITALRCHDTSFRGKKIKHTLHPDHVTGLPNDTWVTMVSSVQRRFGGTQRS